MMETINAILDIALMALAVVGMIISRFEYGEERITTLVWVAIFLAMAGL